MTNDLSDALDMIIRGFARLERGVHPVDEDAVGPVRFLRWPERGRRGQEFSEEFFALHPDPAELLAVVREVGPGPDHLIAVVSTEPEPDQAPYLAAGYEFGSREPLMLTALTNANSTPDPALDVHRVTTMAEVARILAAQQSVGYPERLFTEALLADPHVSIRAVFVDGQFVAIGKLAVVESGGYITDVMTMPGHRRQGYGAGVVRQLHADARAAGAERSALTSTAMARSLYEQRGYRQIGFVTLYATPERVTG
ncbi:MAG TPA: GNAT family N-acetyltransferase [Thermomicrobiales bacterium]|nr:GNAT family N-acetyltransferase [Thermomicrobiales bacterium]